MTISAFANANTYADDGWSGFGRPTRRRYREKKRLEAEERQAAFDTEVDRTAREQNIDRLTAFDVVRRRRRHEHRIGAR